MVTEDKRWQSNWPWKLCLRLFINWILLNYRLLSISRVMLDQRFIPIGQAGTKIVYNALIQTVQKYNYSLMTAVMGMRRTTTIGNSSSWKHNFLKPYCNYQKTDYCGEEEILQDIIPTSKVAKKEIYHFFISMLIGPTFLFKRTRLSHSTIVARGANARERERIVKISPGCSESH